MVIVAVSAPTAYYSLRVSDARTRAQDTAMRVAEALNRDATTQPVLWKYNSLKVLRHVREFQLQTDIANVVVVDRNGGSIDPKASTNIDGPVVWAHAPIRAGSIDVGRVWVAVSTRTARRSAFLLAFGFSLLGLFLAGLMYLLPLRILSGAEKQLRRGERLRELSGHSAALEETERRAIARDLHDSAGQVLTAIRINLQLIADKADNSGDERVGDLADTTIDLTDQTLEEIRRAVESLGPAILDDVGLEKALQRMCNDVTDRSDVQVALTTQMGERKLSAAVETTCYRIIQEALTNIERHAKASEVNVSLVVDSASAVVVVRDDGAGFDAAQPSARHGLSSMRARAELLGGEIEVTSNPGRGSLVRAVLPALRDDRDQVASPGE